MAKALDGLPDETASFLDNVAVVVEDEPTDEELRDAGLDPETETLFGLYQGMALPDRGGSYGNVLPDRIVVYRRPLLAECSDRRRVDPRDPGHRRPRGRPLLRPRRGGSSLARPPGGCLSLSAQPSSLLRSPLREAFFFAPEPAAGPRPPGRSRRPPPEPAARCAPTGQGDPRRRGRSRCSLRAGVRLAPRVVGQARAEPSTPPAARPSGDRRAPGELSTRARSVGFHVSTRRSGRSGPARSGAMGLGPRGVWPPPSLLRGACWFVALRTMTCEGLHRRRRVLVALRRGSRAALEVSPSPGLPRAARATGRGPPHPRDRQERCSLHAVEEGSASPSSRP